MTLHTYLPQDRLRAIANNTTLPDRTSGSALFADISGFTALTESLRETLGSRQGAEELSKRLNAVFTALISELELYGGSVISFAGDSIICWFDGAESAARSVRAGMNMQVVITKFPELFLKVSIATGEVRRFVVGDNTIQRIDVLAGNTVMRSAIGEHLTGKGEVLADDATVEALGDGLFIGEWREGAGAKFALVKDLKVEVTATGQTAPNMEAELAREWVLPHLQGRDSFLREFRPGAALFIRFMGIDFEAGEAQGQLDEFVQEMQKTAERYGGAVLQLTIGDKGSYAYVNFGVLTAHEDDARRAVKAALEIRGKTELQVQMGITKGLMLVGAYGGETRKALGALGDDVNLAARLMTTAKENEILLSSHIHKAVMDEFTFEPHPPLPMKGKAEPLLVFAVTGESQKRAVRLQEPNYLLPMVGRQAELKIIEEKLELAKEGKSQVISIVAEAGLGKSRLVAEVIRTARRKGFVGFGGACQSDAIHTPYQAWKSIWQAFFEVDHEMSLKKQMRLIEGEIEDRAPERVAAMPLLNVVLELNIPDNEFTQNLEPKIRQSALHALLEDCLKAQAGDEPILIVIEDLHWIDALSHELLEQLTKALANHAVCFVLAYRPPQLERWQAPRIEALAQLTRIALSELTQAEAESAIRAKLAQLYPARGNALPTGLVDKLMARAQGNPFYLEELLNYLHDRSIDPSQLDKIELPDSLHALILSRIDQLSEAEKTTLRVASIIGRQFRAKWLTGYYPELGSFPQVKASLDALSGLDITHLDSPEPDWTYLFKHIVIHEVTYESLPFATRARLHEQLARYLESADAPVETIAFHYGRSENKAKKMEYMRKAGEASQKNFANDAALEYYGTLLPLLKDDKEKIQIHLKHGEVLQLIGRFAEAESDYRAALEIARDDLASSASAQYALGKLNRQRGDYEPALEWLRQAKESRALLNDTKGLAQVLIETGMMLWRKGDYTHAREPLNEGLALAREANDKFNTALALNALGSVAYDQGNHAAARVSYEESLALRRKMGDKAGIAESLTNLGNVANNQGDYPAARTLHEESLTLVQEMGDKWGIALSLGNLGLVGLAQGDYAAARVQQEESLALRRGMGDKWGIAISLGILGNVALAQGDHAAARVLYEESLILCKERDEKSLLAFALLGLGMVDLAEGKPTARENILASLRLRQEAGEQLYQISSLIGVAGLILQKGDAGFAARLLGAVDSTLKALHAVVEDVMNPFHEPTLAKVKEALGEAAFRSAWEEGSQWSLKEAVKKALGEGQQ